jgi:hypothetical protein
MDAAPARLRMHRSTKTVTHFHRIRSDQRTNRRPDSQTPDPRKEKAMSEDVVLSSMLDHRYRVAVTRTASYQGELTIAEDGVVLHKQTVGLMYDALFGPDVCDVHSWQELAVDFIDGRASDQ